MAELTAPCSELRAPSSARALEGAYLSAKFMIFCGPFNLRYGLSQNANVTPFCPGLAKSAPEYGSEWRARYNINYPPLAASLNLKHMQPRKLSGNPYINAAKSTCQEEQTWESFDRKKKHRNFSFDINFDWNWNWNRNKNRTKANGKQIELRGNIVRQHF